MSDRNHRGALCSGKTTLLNVLAEGQPLETCPTIGLNVKRVKRGGVNMKCWCVWGPFCVKPLSARFQRCCRACRAGTLAVNDSTEVNGRDTRGAATLSCLWWTHTRCVGCALLCSAALALTTAIPDTAGANSNSTERVAPATRESVRLSQRLAASLGLKPLTARFLVWLPQGARHHAHHDLCQ